MFNETVWTDSDGAWHASVPVSDKPHRDVHAARAAIRAAAGPTGGRPLRVVLERHTGHGTAIYRGDVMA
jgi:hypothetical protein